MAKIKIYSWFAVLLWAALIWLLSSIPHLKSNLSQDFLLRKIAHLLEYAILLLLLKRAWPKLKNASLVVGSAALVSLGYAVLDEFHQSFVAGRVGSFLDILIDLSGILLAVSWLAWSWRQDPNPLKKRG